MWLKHHGGLINGYRWIVGQNAGGRDGLPSGLRQALSGRDFGVNFTQFESHLLKIFDDFTVTFTLSSYFLLLLTGNGDTVRLFDCTMLSTVYISHGS